MQMLEAIKLAKKTTLEDKKKCNHSWEKEYNLSADTGDYACTNCGATISRVDYKKDNMKAICY